MRILYQYVGGHKNPYMKVHFERIKRTWVMVSPVIPVEVKPLNKKKKLSIFRQYIKSEHWKQFRDQYKSSGLPQECKICGSQKYQLHHLTYERKGAELFADVVPLCWEHHRKVHNGAVGIV